jgi:CheY-like chemotaxis protein
MDPQAPQPPLSNPPKKLLIVEDDFYIRDIYKLAAKNKGYVVYTASDGEEALSLCKVAHPDIILLDIMLPKVSGIDVLKTIKSWPEFAHIPIVMVTNVGENETYQQALQAGAADYILKVQQTPVQIVEGLTRFFPQNNPPAGAPPAGTPPSQGMPPTGTPPASQT